MVNEWPISWATMALVNQSPHAQPGDSPVFRYTVKRLGFPPAEGFHGQPTVEAKVDACELAEIDVGVGHRETRPRGISPC